MQHPQSQMNLCWIFSVHIQVHPPNETAAFDDMVSSWVPKKCGQLRFSHPACSCASSFSWKCSSCSCCVFFKWGEYPIRSCSPTHPAIFLYTTHIYVYIRICNMYMWLYTHIYNIYMCIITSSSYMLVIQLLFQGVPHSHQPVRPEKFS